jgi:hypothetical protein
MPWLGKWCRFHHFTSSLSQFCYFSISYQLYGPFLMELTYQYLVHLVTLSDEYESSCLQSVTEEMYFEPHQYDRPTDNFTQSELNDPIRELQLTKETSGLLGSRLRERTCWHPGLNFLGTGIVRKNFENIMHRKINLYFVRIFVIFCISWERQNVILAPFYRLFQKKS